MKELILLPVIIFTFISSLNSQCKRDYIWLFASSPNLDLKSADGNIMDFNNKGKIDTVHLYDTVRSTNTAISDEEGHLLFYFNGCRVIDSTQQIMENGDSINYGETWDKYCGRFSNYPGTQNSIILPDPGKKDGYYLIHKRNEIQLEPELKSHNPNLYYSYIDMTSNEGRGKVVKKNKIIFSTSSILPTYLTACKHANGEDWWIIEQEQDTNIYFKVLLTKDSIMLFDYQTIGPILNDYSGFGQAVFSPNGKYYLIYNKQDDVLVYDFNRETGELDNFRQVEVLDSNTGFCGIAVSPNSKYAYLSSTFDLYQIDLHSDDIKSTLTHIDHIDGFQDPTFYSLFGQTQLAPDCKIYIVSSGTNNYLHIINRPNEKGKACDFQQHSIYLPNRNYNNSIPNFPHFRIDEEDICDSTITWLPNVFYPNMDIMVKLYPNPAKDKFTLFFSSPLLYEVDYSLIDMQGMKIMNGKIPRLTNKHDIITKYFRSGMYMIKISGKNNLINWTGKIKIE